MRHWAYGANPNSRVRGNGRRGNGANPTLRNAHKRKGSTPTAKGQPAQDCQEGMRKRVSRLSIAPSASIDNSKEASTPACAEDSAAATCGNISRQTSCVAGSAPSSETHYKASRGMQCDGIRQQAGYPPYHVPLFRKPEPEHHMDQQKLSNLMENPSLSPFPGPFGMPMTALGSANSHPADLSTILGSQSSSASTSFTQQPIVDRKVSCAAACCEVVSEALNPRTRFPLPPLSGPLDSTGSIPLPDPSWNMDQWMSNTPLGSNGVFAYNSGGFDHFSGMCNTMPAAQCTEDGPMSAFINRYDAHQQNHWIPTHHSDQYVDWCACRDCEAKRTGMSARLLGQ